MKGFLGVCLAALVLYSIYYDLKIGTLPTTTHAATVESGAHHSSKINIPFKKVKVQPGETVLSIVEQLQGSKAVGIQKIVHDFEKLNPGVDANEIQIGHIYRFPVYNKQKQ
ncbi:MAG TPA: LysM domain-containing protein [Bacillales bacterium]|nr:LysM domain-containing protein [Bacillales bacterium]